MSTSILVVGGTAASSSSFTLAAGESAALIMVGASASGAGAIIEMQASDNSWVAVGSMGASSFSSAVVLQATGTFRVTRPAGAAFGIERG